jgi:hypothetical protein
VEVKGEEDCIETLSRRLEEPDWKHKLAAAAKIWAKSQALL